MGNRDSLFMNVVGVLAIVLLMAFTCFYTYWIAHYYDAGEPVKKYLLVGLGVAALLLLLRAGYNSLKLGKA